MSDLPPLPSYPAPNSNITPTARSLFTSKDEHSAPSDLSPTRNTGHAHGHAVPPTAGSTPRAYSSSKTDPPGSTSKDTLSSLSQRWASLSSSIRVQAQSSAELLVQQATCTSQAEDLVRLLLLQLEVREEEKARLEAQVIQDRADFTAQAKLLSQHFTTSHHRNTALHVANEALQAELRDLKGIIEMASSENQALRQQISVLAQEHSREREARTRAEGALQEHGAATEEMGAELQHSRAMCEELQGAREKLQAQVRAMVKAEKELTENLKQTHGQIDDQLNMLREQLQSERQKRIAANRRKVELAQQVATLTSHLEACKEALENEVNLNLSYQSQHRQSSSPLTTSGGKGHSTPSPGAQPSSGSKQAIAGGRAAVASAKASLRAASAPKPATPPALTPPPSGVGYTAAFAPPAAVSRAVTPEISSSSRTQAKPLFPAYPPPPPLLAVLRKEKEGQSSKATSVAMSVTSEANEDEIQEQEVEQETQAEGEVTATSEETTNLIDLM